MSTPELADLQQRVARLERSTTQQSEAATPNYFTVNTNGTVTAIFTGGLLINENVPGGIYTPSNAVGWRSPNGIVPEFIQGYLPFPNVHDLILMVNPQGTGNGDFVNINMQSQIGVSSFLEASAQDTVLNITQNARILDSAGRSDFWTTSTHWVGKIHALVSLANGAAGTETGIGLVGATVDTDPNGWWVAASSSFKPNKAGWFIVIVKFNATVAQADNNITDVGVSLNGAVMPNSEGLARFPSNAAGVGPEVIAVAMVHCNGTTDTIGALGNSTTAGMTGNLTLSILSGN